jgi:hypothetical protein
MGCVFAHKGNPLAQDSDIRSWQDLSRLHTYPATISDHQISFFPPHRNIDKRPGSIADIFSSHDQLS